ncbi:hypothetical protein ABVN80_08335 [Acinetobacter baumannii]
MRGYIGASDVSKLEISDGWGALGSKIQKIRAHSQRKHTMLISLRDWDIYCKKDKIDNKKVCSMWRDGLTVMMIQW